jgi:sarcosine oxidase subunit beta
MGKIIVCPCEDVTLDELQAAFETGHRDVESLKRFTGLATGLCQGKCCIAHAARFLAGLKGGDEAAADPPRTRPLLQPTPVACFAGPEPLAPEPGARSGEHPGEREGAP